MELLTARQQIALLEHKTLVQRYYLELLRRKLAIHQAKIEDAQHLVRRVA